MTERAIVYAIRAELDYRGAWHTKTHGSVHGRRGIPDILAIHYGHALAIEVKQPGEQPAPLQRYELDRVRRAGGTALVAHSVDDVRQALDQIEAQAHRDAELRDAA